MEGLALLLILSTAMFLGCWLAGLVPLSVSLGESRVRLVTVFGAGLLVGTALAVIIPEGVSAVYQARAESSGTHHSHGPHASADSILDRVVVKEKDVGALRPNPGDHHAEPPKLPAEEEKETAKKEAPLEPKAARRRREIGQGHFHDSSSRFNVDVHSIIGVALVLGFVFMLCVDQISAMGNFGRRDVEGGAVQPRYKITATIGLVVHAAADGIALGAASTTSHTEIQFIVFLAIMLHKAPAAFGLVTFLQYEGLDKARIRKHLLVFALAAPVAALVTYVGILQGGSTALSSLTSTGILMLFSAGTFLYVATVHVLPEIVGGGRHSQSHSYQPVAEGSSPGSSTALGHSHAPTAAFKLNELVAIVAGALIPALITLGHSH